MSRMMKARTVAADLLDKLVLRLRPAEKIPGPYPVFVRKTAMGAEVTVDSLAKVLLASLMAEMAEDPEGVAEEARYLAGAKGAERDRLLEDLVDRAGGAKIPFDGIAARRLADRLNTAAGPVPFIPRQQDGKAA